MNLLLVSQNRVFDQKRNERRDYIDSRLVDFFRSMSFESLTVPNGASAVRLIGEHVRPMGIVLSGGSSIGVEPQRDETERQLLDYAVAETLPVLGICRGMQMMNHYLSGSLKRVSEHAATTHSLWSEEPGFTRSEVNSYHNFQLDLIGKGLGVAATSNDGVVEAVTHHELPWLGIMWHPERVFPFDEEDRQLVIDLFSRARFPGGVQRA